jgi:hypothetical protein
MFVPYGTGAAKLAVDVRITALHAFFTQVNAVLGTHVAGFPIRMIGACSHCFPLEWSVGVMEYWGLPATRYSISIIPLRILKYYSFFIS